MPKIKYTCSKCGDHNIETFERTVSNPVFKREKGIRCQGCGHEKVESNDVQEVTF